MVQPTRVKLGCGQPYPAQVAFLARRGTKATGYTETHLKAGLSAGKTLAEALKAWFSVTKWNPGVPGLITFPEYKYTWQTFLPVWKFLVPERYGLWKYHKSEHRISFSFSDAEIWLMSRSNPEDFRAFEVAWHIGDEASADKDVLPTWELIATRVRHKHAREPFHDSVSTPLVGPYTKLIRRPGAHVIHVTSAHNPYVDRAWLEKQKANFGPEKYKEQILAEEINLRGRAWKGFSDEQWPAGNMHWARFDPTKPWWISADIGLNSSYGIWQTCPAQDKKNRAVWDGNIDVRVAQFQPNGEDTNSTLRRIAAKYTTAPTVFYTGSDTENNREVITGRKAAQIIREIWKQHPPRIVIPSSDDRYKDMQYDRLDAAMHSADGRRRLCVSKHMESHNETERGILDVVNMDVFPAKQPRRGAFLNDNDSTDPLGLRHCRDEMMYYAVGRYPHNRVRMAAA